MKIALIGNDKEYLKDLMTFIQKSIYEVDKVTIVDISLVSTLSNYDYVLVMETMASSPGLESISGKIELTKQPSQRNDSLYMFMGKNELIQKLRNKSSDVFLEAEKESSKSTNRQSSCIAITSASGNIGNSVLAITLSNCLSKNKKVLCIELDSRSPKSLFLETKATKYLSDLLCKMQLNGCVDMETIDDYICKYGEFHFLGGVINPLDLLQETCGRLTKLIEIIKKENRYDYIILDINNNIGRSYYPLLGISDDILFMMDHNEISIQKGLLFLSSIKKVEISNKIFIYNKIRYIINRYRADKEIYQTQDLIEKSSKLYYSRNLIIKSDGNYQVNTNSPFYSSVTQLSGLFIKEV